MKNFIYKTILMASLLLLVNTSAYAEGCIVVSKDIKVEEFTKDEIERIFLGKTTILRDGTRVQVVLSSGDDKIANGFLKKFTGKTQRRFKKYWLKLVFAGYGIAPKFFKNDQKAKEYIENQEGVVAFITEDEIKDMKNLKMVIVSN